MHTGLPNYLLYLFVWFFGYGQLTGNGRNTMLFFRSQCVLTEYYKTTIKFNKDSVLLDINQQTMGTVFSTTALSASEGFFLVNIPVLTCLYFLFTRVAKSNSQVSNWFQIVVEFQIVYQF